MRYPWYRGTREKLNVEVLDIADLPSMYTLLMQRRLRWLCHVHRMKDGMIPKDRLYREPAEGERPTGRPFLRFSDVCKGELKAPGIDLDSRETLGSNRAAWKITIKSQLPIGEAKWKEKCVGKHARRKLMLLQTGYLNLLLLLYARIVKGTVRPV